MDFLFNCTECEQQLEVDSAAAGTTIECPTCGKTILIPKAELEEVMVANTSTHTNTGTNLAPVAQSAEAKVERHFVVPTVNQSEILIKKPAVPLEAAAKESDKKFRIKTIKRGDCQEVGRDRFDEFVTDYLSKVGELNIVSIHPISYSHIDIETRALVVDFGVMIIYRA